MIHKHVKIPIWQAAIEVAKAFFFFANYAQFLFLGRLQFLYESRQKFSMQNWTYRGTFGQEKNNAIYCIKTR